MRNLKILIFFGVFISLINVSFAAEIKINPLVKLQYPSTQHSLLISGTIEPAHGGPGSVVCGDLSASFTAQKAWQIELPLKGGQNTLSCTFTKNKKSDSASVQVFRNQLPKSEFTITTTSDNIAPELVSFNGSQSSDPDGAIQSYEWSFGNGQISESANASTTFTDANTYSISLKVTDAFGESTTKTQSIIISPNNLPIASFTTSKLTGKAPLKIIFDASSSSDEDAGDKITAFDWSFGEGASSQGKIQEHIFETQGTYTVKLQVKDNNNGISEVTKEIIVLAPNVKPLASLSADRVFGHAPLLVNYNAGPSSDSDGTVTQYIANFGDGSGDTVFTSPTFSHTFQQEGQYSISFKVKDDDEALSEAVIVSLKVAPEDHVAPFIQLGIQDNLLTNNSELTLPISVADASEFTTQVWHNGLQIFDGNEISFDLPVTLNEGINLFQIKSIDTAGNESSIHLSNIMLDTVAPGLSSLNLAQGQVIRALHFTLIGSSSESLKSITINGEMGVLNSNGSFQYVINHQMAGIQTLSLQLEDLAGNTSEYGREYELVLRILDSLLISVVPREPEGVTILGRPGAAKPGAEISASSGFFNTGSAIAAEDGSFSIDMDLFSVAAIEAYDAENDRTEEIEVTYNSSTTLAGIVKDIYENPIPGVTVTIINSNQTAVTNASGVFNISNPVLGDQTILVDGTTVPSSVTNDEKSFSKVTINVNLGNKQQNVLERAIYLVPKLMDGTETIVENGEAATVESPHAPGVKLEIPAGTTTFPGGTLSGSINIMEIPADKASIELMEEAEPTKVIALEPSGLKFNQRIDVTLPNDNEFPEGTELVILSKNSETGLWEVDGAATVTGSDTIETKPGEGISHFSEIYAAPLGMEMKKFADGDKPTIDAMSGAISTSISMPSFKSMGQDVAPSLVYNSQWANPNVVISNVFDLPRKYLKMSGIVGGSGGIGGSTIKDVTIQQWITPEYIDAQFASGDIVSEKIRFTGLPNKSLVSYQMDLSELPTGIYPAKSSYEIRFKALTIRTTRKKDHNNLTGKTTVKKRSYRTEKLLDAIFPPDLLTTIYHQNKVEASEGQGWRLNLGKKILNPQQDRIIVENESGTISPYILKNTIETLAYNANGIDSVGSSEDKVVYTSGKSIFSYQNGQSSSYGTLPTSTVTLGMNVQWFQVYIGSGWNVWNCHKQSFLEEVVPEISGILNDGQNFYFADSFRGNITSFDGSTFNSLNDNRVAAKKSRLIGPRLAKFVAAAKPDIQPICTAGLNKSCQNSTYSNQYKIRYYGDYNVNNFFCSELSSRSLCYSGSCTTADRESTGFVYATGFNSTNNSLTSALFNAPRGVAKGPSNTLLVADTGNNIVRKIDQSNGTILPFAGNRTTFDTGDNGPAISAGIYHPRGVVADNAGNAYITAERGYIKIVTPDGTISQFAGKPTSQGGNLTDIAHMKEMALSEPSGIVYDQENSYLYVADTGHNRVLRIDLNSEEARVVAGNGTCVAGDTLDGKAALEVSLCRPEKIALDSTGNLLILDEANKRIRRVNLITPADGIIRYQPMAKDNSELMRNANGEFALNYRDGRQTLFSATGLELQTIDRVGRSTGYQYDEAGRMFVATLPTGQSIQISYSGDKLDSITDAAGRTTQFNHSGNLLTSVSFPDGTERNFDYNENGVLVEEFNQRNFSTKYGLNKWDRLQKVTREDGSFITMDDAISKTISNENTENNPAELRGFGSDQDSLQDIIRDAKGNETVFIKDENGYVQTIKDSKDRITTVERDGEGRPTKIIKPDLTFTILTYDQITGDFLSRFESESNTVETYSYNPRGLLTSYKDQLNNIQTYIYNDLDLLTQEIDPNGNSVSHTYNSLGLVLSSSNNLGLTTTYSYNPAGNLVKITAPMGEQSILVRDDVGNVLSKTNAKGQTSHYSLDQMNRLISVRTSGNLLTSYSYLPTGELSLITNPAGFLTTFEYDEIGRLSKKTSPKGQTSRMFYDSNDNLIKEITPRGDSKFYEYNESNQLTKRTLPDNVYQYSFDDKGNLLTASNDSSTKEFTYVSILGNDYLKTISTAALDLPPHSMTYGYNGAGKRKSMTSDFINLSYSYDSGYRMTGVSNSLGQSFNFGYDQANRLISISRPNSVNSVLTFDTNSFLKELVHKKGTSLIDGFIYTRDQLGNRTSITTPRGVQNYSYDTENQLISASHPEADALHTLETFSYDSLGNRTSDNQGGFTYDEKQMRLEEDYKYLYIYDLNGNITSKQEKGLTGKVWNYIYSSEDQLLKAELFEGTSKLISAQYFYDVFGKRIKKSIQNLQNSTSFERKYVYDGGEIIAELDEDNSVLARYTHSGLSTDDVLSADITSDGVSSGLAMNAGSYLYLKDALGSVQAITTESGNVVQRYVYSSYGKLLKVVDVAGLEITPLIKTSFTYTNREHDEETGLYYYRARFYDAHSGRFMQEDPDAGRLSHPITFNSQYSYANNNPVDLIDPTGTFGIPSGLKLFGDYVTRNYFDKLKEGTVNFYNANKKTIIGVGSIGVAVAIVVFAPAFAATPPGQMVVGGLIGGGINTLTGKSSNPWTDFGKGFAAGAIATGAVLGGAAIGGWAGGPTGTFIGGTFAGAGAAESTTRITQGRSASLGELMLGAGLGGVGGLINSAGVQSTSFNGVRTTNQTGFEYGMSANGNASPQ